MVPLPFSCAAQQSQNLWKLCVFGHLHGNPSSFLARAVSAGNVFALVFAGETHEKRSIRDPACFAALSVFGYFLCREVTYKARFGGKVKCFFDYVLEKFSNYIARAFGAREVCEVVLLRGARKTNKS